MPLEWVVLTFVCLTADSALIIAQTNFGTFPDDCVTTRDWGMERRKAYLEEIIAVVETPDKEKVITVARVKNPLENTSYFSAGETQMNLW